MDCSKELLSVIASDCAASAVAGVYGEVILLPFKDIDKPASTVADNVISEIIMKSGAKGVQFTTLDNSVLGATSLSALTYVRKYQHDLTLRAFLKNEKVKAAVNGMTNSRMVAIVKNFDGGEGGEVTYEVYGWDAGLVVTGVTAGTDMADGVPYEIVMGNDDTSKESSLPKSVWDTDLETTETMLAGLLPVAP